MPRGRGRGPQMSNEKAKDFKGTMKKLMAYLSAYKIGIFFVIVFAIGSTIFNIVGPKILGKATTEIFKGLVRKVSGGSGIDFDKIAHIVLTLLCLYLTSAVFSFVQGYIMTGVSQKLTYRLRKEILEAAAGLFMGIFVGGLIMSLAEVLEIFPILLRRGRIQSGIPWMVLSIGIGKMLGAYLYFSNL